MQYFVYIMTNKPRGTLYIGITNDLIRRVHEHKTGLIDGFTKKYNLKNLCYFEIHDYVYNALQREKNLKHWRREWKINVIEEVNPQWKDLWETICE
ncbi:MAG TPA: GIY-YIG nuclease family protein [Alphaproteobacteria bacterium]|nr:GIY-YIG nuclease family protein [Alphaproteobacteria bacterium]